MDPKVFISCHHENVPYAENLQAALKILGVDAWFYREVPNGAFLGNEIHSHLRQASLVVVLITPHSMESSYVAYEYCLARFELEKELYFVQLEACEENRGIYGVIREKHFLEPVLEGDASGVVPIAEKIKARLNVLPELLSAGEMLVSPADDKVQQASAMKLAQTVSYRRVACECLLRAIKYQVDTGRGYGPVQQSIAEALSIVGDERAIPYLRKFREMTQDEAVHGKIDIALTALTEREYCKPL